MDFWSWREELNHPTVAGSALGRTSRLLRGGHAPSYAPHEGGPPPSKTSTVGGSTAEMHGFLELARGIEPPTCGLQNHCSAIELRQPALFFAHLALTVKRSRANCAPNCARKSHRVVSLRVGLADDRIAAVGRACALGDGIKPSGVSSRINLVEPVAHQGTSRN